MADPLDRSIARFAADEAERHARRLARTPAPASDETRAAFTFAPGDAVVLAERGEVGVIVDGRLERTLVSASRRDDA